MSKISSDKGCLMVEYENIETHKDGAIAVIKVNRPEVRNALDAKTIDEISLAFEEWEKHDGVQVIIFTGEGQKSFVSGADINQLQKKTALDGLTADLSTLCRKIDSSFKATIASINGFALGGGCEIALACDIRIASTNAKLGFPELNLSIIPGGGGTQRLSRIVGKGQALDMILTGKIISAEEAKKISLVSEVVDQEDLWEETLQKATAIIDKGPLAVKLGKLVIHEGHDANMDTGLAMEKLAQFLLFWSEDKQEGINAFFEKRKPVFKGK